MGRAKLKMGYISDPKKRNKTYKTRKECLFKKLHELTTLCDVKACAIIYDGSKQEPEIWPNDRDNVREMIDLSKTQEWPAKTYTLSDFYSDKKREIKEELDTLRKKNREDKYPNWVESLDALKEPELRQFAGMLGDKLRRVYSRIDELKARKSMAKQEELSQAYWNMLNQQQGIPTPRPLEMSMPHGHCCYPGPAEQQFNQMHSVYQNYPMSMPTLLTNNNCGGQAVYDQSTFGFGAVNPMIYDSQGPVGAYYTGLPLLPHEWLQFLPREN